MQFDPEAIRAFEHAGWQQVAAEYDATFAQATAPFAEALLDAAGVAAGLRVLDLCCGTGVVTAAAAARDARPVGLDFSAAMLAEARQTRPRLRFDQAGAEALPYADGSFDAAVSNFGVHHLPSPQKAVAEAFRVLSPGGRVALTTWAAPAENIAWRLLFDAIRDHGDPDAAKTPPSGGNLGTTASVLRLLREAGFANVRAEPIRREWHVADPRDLLAALARGTVRTAALIAAQPAAARPAIEAAMARAAAPYRTADGFAVPIVAILARGTKSTGMTDLAADVLIVGAGGAGMYAAISAARAGAGQILLVDKSLIGRGGATVMAQMTVAAALGEECADDWRAHLADTLTSGRGLCDENLAALLCEHAPARIREMEVWRIGWARRPDGHIAQVIAPGHSRPRCCYVDFLNTGPAVAATLRRQIGHVGAIRRVSNLLVTDLVVADGEVAGAVALDTAAGMPVTIAAKAVVIATGGLTRIYRRNSASANMGGDGYALALAAGAELVDMEFVQFFPIGHLAPRLVGMDPIMWDPFRYKLGGRLLDGAGREFLSDYGSDETSGYTTPRDIATYAIQKEVAAGRGSPHGGVYLSFTHVPRSALAAAFGPVIERLANNGIDLGAAPVEVAPIAHYHMGGIAVDERLMSRVPGLFAAGEAAGGANGANRLSGNAIPEALVFGEHAGRAAATYAAGRRSHAPPGRAGASATDRLRRLADGRNGDIAAAELLEALREVMWRDVGTLRNAAGLDRALARIGELRAALPEVTVAPGTAFNASLGDWVELRASLLAAEAVTRAAAARCESRGAHQRNDFPDTDSAFAHSLRVSLTADGAVTVDARQ